MTAFDAFRIVVNRCATPILPPVLAALTLCVVAVAAAGEIRPGQILLTEPDTGSVVDVRPGGDLSAATRFATGLSSPRDVCVGPGGNLYVAEIVGGRVRVITEGGDVSEAPVFASGLIVPVALACDETHVFVLEAGPGEVTDVTAGGDFSFAAPFASGLELPRSLLLDSSGTLWVSDRDRIVDITAGGDFTDDPGYASGGLLFSGAQLVERDQSLLAANDQSAGPIVDWTAGGPWDTLPWFARLPFVDAVVDAGVLGLFAASGAEVFEISAGGAFADATPYATGVRTEDPLGRGFTLVPGCGSGVIDPPYEECDDGNTVSGDGCAFDCILEVCGDGTVQDGEECDDDGTADGDGCDAECYLEICGNGVVQPLLGESCDDGNTVAGDGCDATCQNELCGDGVVQGGLGEECDDGNTVPGDRCSETCAVERIPLEAEVRMLQIKVRFDRETRDKVLLKLKGWTLPDGFVAAGAAVSVDAGGAVVAGVLDATGRHESDDGFELLKLKQKTDGTWKLVASRKKADFADLLADEGLVEEDNAKPGKPVTVRLEVTLDGERYEREVQLSYRSAVGLKGKAK